MDSLLLHFDNDKYQIKIAPVVILTILDHYKRKNDGAERVFGGLLGYKTGNIIVVRSSFPFIVHEVSDNQITLNFDYLNSMIKLQTRVSPINLVIGWYTTGDSISFTTSLVHEAFLKYTPEPLLLLVNPFDFNFKHNIHCFLNNFNTYADSQNVLVTFYELPFTYDGCESEKSAVASMMSTCRSNEPILVGNVYFNTTQTLKHLLLLLEEICGYIDMVVNGKIEMDNNIGSKIAECIQLIPTLDSVTFQRLLDSSLQESLMMMYVNGLAKAQLALSIVTHK